MTWDALNEKRKMLIAVMDLRFPGTPLDICNPATVYFWLQSEKTVGEIAAILGGQPERPSIGQDVPKCGAF